MSTKKIYLVGKKFGRITVLHELKERNKNNNIMYLCKCECGKTKEILGSNLRRGSTKSCGCLNNENKIKHNLSESSEYSTLKGMIRRCYNPKYESYHRYGGRGIKVCDRWKGENGFINFIEDMGMKPTLKHTIDRIDNDGDYNIENCKWATRSEQAKNTSRTNNITYKGITKCLSDWCKEYKIDKGTFYNRIKAGYSIENALEQPIRKRTKKNK